ncbi:MAG: hypothetical protein J7J99_06710 [Thermoprotei archaeon]|nr:hypothetical protein [Thermoprotei archaeon]
MSFITTIAFMIVRNFIRYINLSIAIILIVIGLLSLRGIKISIYHTMPIRMKKANLKTSFMAITYRFTYGIVSMSCSLPVLLMLISASLKAKSMLELIFVALAYIVGVVIPFTGVGIITVISKSMAMSISTRIAKYVDRVSGVLIILAGIYILIDTFLW